MAETPTFGRYAEIPYEQMTPEQQEGYRSLIETRGRLPGPNKIYVHNPKLAKVMGRPGRHSRPGICPRSAKASSPAASSAAPVMRPNRTTPPNGAGRAAGPRPTPSERTPP